MLSKIIDFEYLRKLNKTFNIMKNSIKNFAFVICILFFCACSSSEDSSNGCEQCTYTVAQGETSATVSSALIGEFNLTLDLSLNGYDVPQGTKGKFTVSTNEMIVEIEGKECITLKNPISTSPVEYTFKDNCRDDLMYSISESSNGGVNEVNVITINGTFIGQFK